MYFGHAFAIENWALFTTFPIGARASCWQKKENLEHRCKVADHAGNQQSANVFGSGTLLAKEVVNTEATFTPPSATS